MNVFAIDFRSLRLFRFGLGIYLIFDLLLRLADFTSLHTNSGVLPSALARDLAPGTLRMFSLFYFSDSLWWTGFLFAVMAVCAVLLICNYRTRVVSLITFILAMSLKHRNEFVVYGGDDLFRLCLMWSVFLPSGPPQEGQKDFSGPAAIAIFLQVFALYFCAGMHKTYDAWFVDPRGAYMALSASTYSRPLASVLLQFPTFLEFSTMAVFLVERAGWIVFFSPWYSGPLRTLGVVMFASMHTIFAFPLHLELFPVIDVVLITLMLPTWFWDRFGVALPPAIIPRIRLDPYLAPVALGMAIILTYVNIALFPDFKMQVLKPIKKFARALSMNQQWGMFSPIDGISNGYHRIIAKTPDGLNVDLLNGRVLDAFPLPPIDVQKEQRGFRWTRFLDSVAGEKRLLDSTLDYLCRTWRPKDPSLRKGLKVDWYYFSEKTVIVPGLSDLQHSSVMHSYVCKD